MNFVVKFCTEANSVNFLSRSPPRHRVVYHGLYISNIFPLRHYRGTQSLILKKQLYNQKLHARLQDALSGTFPE